MASAGSPPPSFLTCMICTETYQDPCTLNCHHTFCRKCILTYLQSCPRPSSIQCPSCKHHTKVQDSTLPLTQWVGQLTPNPIVVKLITQDTEDLKTCFLCNAKGTSVPSKFWCHICDIAMCDTCHQTHSLIPTNRDHEVSQLSQDFKITRKRIVNCKEHPKNEIELCCKTCDKPICQMCCILYHRKCEEVVTMESLKPEMQTKLKEMVDEISQKIDKMSTNVNQKSLMITEVQKEEKDLQTEVSEICKQARDLVAKKEAEMKKIIQEKTKEKMEIVKAHLAAEKLDLQNNQQRKAYLEQLQEQQTTLDMYTVLHTGQAESSPPGNSAADVPRDLLLKSDMDAFKSAVEKMLCLEVKFPEFDPNSTLVLHSTIDSNNTIDLAVLEINGADVCVVTFYDRNHIKAFWMEDTRKESILGLDNFAWGITTLKDNRVAVSIPDGKRISLLNIGTSISEIKSIKTEKKYLGLASVNESTFAAGSSNHGCIDLIDHKGIILKTISDKYIKYPNFILLYDDSSLLVSDWGSHSVYNIGLDGKIKFCYSPKETERQLMENRGVVMTVERHILVTDKKANKVILLTEDGRFVKDVLTASDGLDQPYGLSLHGNKMYIAQFSGPIKIYECQAVK